MRTVLIKKVIYRSLAQKPQELYSIINNYDVISFDVFDTLIKRNATSPEDTFRVVGKVFENDVNKFYMQRVAAEKEARHKLEGNEIKLPEIYDFLNGYSLEERKELMRLEVKIEKQICCAYRPMQEVYNWCIQHKKTVILISDMYLSRKCILELLEKCGYTKPKELYVSCEYGKNKSSGSIYSELKQNAVEKKWLHIGDSIKGDYIMARTNGMSSFLLDREITRPKFFPKQMYYDNPDKYLFYGYLKSFIQNHEQKDFDDYERMGYEILGPMLTGFCTWLNRKFIGKHYEQVLFLARDSKIILETYKKLFGESERCKYFYISRKAAIAACVDLLKNYDELHDLLLAKDSSTIKDLCKGCNIFGKNKKHFLDECSVQLNTSVNYNCSFDKELVFKKAVKYSGHDCKNQRELLLDYLKQEHAISDFAIVDLGWEGRTQWALNRILPGTNIDGYYMGIITKCPDLVNSLSKAAYFGEMTNTDFNARIIMESIALFENLFLTNEGTTIGYIRETKTGMINALHGEPDQIEENASKISCLQNGARKFVEDISKDALASRFEWSADVIIDIYASFATKPTLGTVDLLSNLRFRDNGVHKMGSEHGLPYYLIRPRKLYNDTLHSYYRVLFLKDIFKVNFPYFEMLFKFYNARHKEG